MNGYIIDEFCGQMKHVLCVCVQHLQHAVILMLAVNVGIKSASASVFGCNHQGHYFRLETILPALLREVHLAVSRGCGFSTVESLYGEGKTYYSSG